MMAQATYNPKITYEIIRQILEDDRWHFSMLTEFGESLNMDYADYVSYASLDAFRMALDQGDLSPCELAILVRQARQHVLRTQAKTRHQEGWADFMASYVTNYANNDSVKH